ncbi:hypothetical protein BJ875DRAFT_495560 [Amylocarpus encephaloides]|uniref:Uncharacterized protein n=1 Tax=Amylocarpus encephaloides TaxID=45428 RepID=A0A9P7YKJ2_9HELO|nr:hypothetical protein BJ875DRAFT_495560 [Amylocarpus encephaloides]
MLRTAALVSALKAQTEAVDLSIKTTIGIVNGFITNTTPNVQQFKGIPFAQTSIANLRVLLALRRQLLTILASSIADCPEPNTLVGG